MEDACPSGVHIFKRRSVTVLRISLALMSVDFVCVCVCVYVCMYVCMYGIQGFDSRRRLGIFLFTTASRTALGPTDPPIQWVPWALSLGVKRPGREAGHSPPFSAEVKECVELYLHSPIRLNGVVLS
jgi:hypothetical protein